MTVYEDGAFTDSIQNSLSRTVEKAMGSLGKPGNKTLVIKNAMQPKSSQNPVTETHSIRSTRVCPEAPDLVRGI